MFDANMRYLPKGLKFFAKVHYVKEGSRLWGYGLRSGDLVKCKMRDRSHENPRVKMNIKGRNFTISARFEDEICDSWIVYEGRQDGRGFIDENSYNQAKEMMGGKMEYPYARHH